MNPEPHVRPKRTGVWSLEGIEPARPWTPPPGPRSRPWLAPGYGATEPVLTATGELPAVPEPAVAATPAAPDDLVVDEAALVPAPPSHRGFLKRALAALGLLLVLAGCDNAASGTVTGREHVKQHQELSYFQCVSYDSKMNCRMQVPIYETVPECWRVNFHNEQDDENGAACIDARDYQGYRVGDQFPRPAGPR